MQSELLNRWVRDHYPSLSSLSARVGLCFVYAYLSPSLSLRAVPPTLRPFMSLLCPSVSICVCPCLCVCVLACLGHGKRGSNPHRRGAEGGILLAGAGTPGQDPTPYGSFTNL